MINLANLNDTLSQQLQRISALPAESGELLKNEIARSHAMTNLAGKIIDCADLAIRAAELNAKGFDHSKALSFESSSKNRN